VENIQGVHPSEAKMHSSLFQISFLFPKICQTPWNIFPISPFPKNFSWPCLVVDSKFRIPSYFRCFHAFPPISEKCYFHPTFSNSPLILQNLLVFLHTFCVFCSPYFDHDAFIMIFASHNACTGRPWKYQYIYIVSFGQQTNDNNGAMGNIAFSETWLCVRVCVTAYIRA